MLFKISMKDAKFLGFIAIYKRGGRFYKPLMSSVDMC